MRTTRKTAALFAIMLAVCGLAAAQDGPAEKAGGNSWDARLSNIRGKVFIKQGGKAKRWTAISGGLPLAAEDTIKTGKDSAADISLDGRCIMSLDEATVISLKSLRRKNASFNLASGRFIAIFGDLEQGEEALTVRTPTMMTAVHGAEFAVSYDTASVETAVSIFDKGEFQVYSLDKDGNAAGKGVMLRAHQEVLVKAAAAELVPYEIEEPEAGDPGIIYARQQLALLGRTYKSMAERPRLILRGNAFGKESETVIIKKPKPDIIPKLNTKKSGANRSEGGKPQNGDVDNKQVEDAVFSLRSRLARTGDSEVLSHDELRALVKTGIKNSDSNADFETRVKKAVAKKRGATGSGVAPAGRH